MGGGGGVGGEIPASPVCPMRIYAWVQSHYDHSCWWDVLNIAHTSIKGTCVVVLL